MTVEVRHAATRFVTRTDWLESRHSFSFGAHYDPANVAHGLLVVSNDDVVRGGGGFGTHPHRDMEIVTWVLDGALRHEDTLGNVGVVSPGVVQRLSAGSGVAHAEANASDETAVRFVRMWVRPDALGGDPAYAQADVSALLADGGLHVVAAGSSDPPVTIRQRAAALWVGRLAPGEQVAVPDDRHVHVYVARGAATLAGAGALAEGDAVRLTAAGAPSLTAGDAGAEVLVWATG